MEYSITHSQAIPLSCPLFLLPPVMAESEAVFLCLKRKTVKIPENFLTATLINFKAE